MGCCPSKSKKDANETNSAAEKAAENSTVVAAVTTKKEQELTNPAATVRKNHDTISKTEVRNNDSNDTLPLLPKSSSSSFSSSSISSSSFSSSHAPNNGTTEEEPLVAVNNNNNDSNHEQLLHSTKQPHNNINNVENPCIHHEESIIQNIPQTPKDEKFSDNVIRENDVEYDRSQPSLSDTTEENDGDVVVVVDDDNDNQESNVIFGTNIEYVQEAQQVEQNEKEVIFIDQISHDDENCGKYDDEIIVTISNVKSNNDENVKSVDGTEYNYLSVTKLDPNIGNELGTDKQQGQTDAETNNNHNNGNPNTMYTSYNKGALPQRYVFLDDDENSIDYVPISSLEPLLSSTTQANGQNKQTEITTSQPLLDSNKVVEPKLPASDASTNKSMQDDESCTEPSTQLQQQQHQGNDFQNNYSQGNIEQNDNDSFEEQLIGFLETEEDLLNAGFSEEVRLALSLPPPPQPPPPSPPPLEEVKCSSSICNQAANVTATATETNQNKSESIITSANNNMNTTNNSNTSQPHQEDFSTTNLAPPLQRDKTQAPFDKIEQSPNSLAKCRHCGLKIIKGTDRVGVSMYMTGYRFTGWSFYYFHKACCSNGLLQDLQLSQVCNNNNNDSNQVRTGLLEMLRQTRDKLAKQHHVKHFQVYHNTVMMEIANKMPRNEAELLQCHGIGKYKLEKYGSAILETIDAYQRHYCAD